MKSNDSNVINLVKTLSTNKKKLNNNSNNLDEILNVIGSFGFFQKTQFLLVGFLAIVPSMVAYSYVFVSATPKFKCALAMRTQVVSFQNSSHDTTASLFASLNDEYMNDADVEKYEHSIEIKSFVRLSRLDNRTNYDNKCNIENSMLSFANEIKKINESLLSRNRLVDIKCVDWMYDDSVYGKTTVSDWNLVCLKSHLKAVTQNAFILGTGCSLFTGILSDKFGRKSALILMITLMVLVLNIQQFFMHSAVLTINQKFVIFTFSRFLQGVAQTMYSISFVLLLEITAPKHRVTAGNILAYSFSIGQIILVGLSYHFKNWLKVQWTLAIYVIPFFLYYWLVPESPRWLLSVNRVRSAREVLIKITRVNNWYNNTVKNLIDQNKFLKRKFSHCLEKNFDIKTQETQAYLFSLLQEDAKKLAETKKNTSYALTLTGITRSPVLMRRCFILFYTWMVILAVYLGIGMGISGNLDKFIDPYLVFLIAAVCEFVSIVTCHVVLDKYGRKKPLVVFMILNAISIYLIPFYFEKYPYVSIFFYFLAKYSIGAAQLTCMIFTSELYPTPMRSTGVGLSAAIARLGGVWAPQINVLSSTLGSIYIPFIIFSLFSLLAGFLCLFLPETLKKSLPESIKDAKKLNKK